MRPGLAPLPAVRRGHLLVEGEDKDKFPEPLYRVKAGQTWDEIFGELYGWTLEQTEDAFVEHYGG